MVQLLWMRSIKIHKMCIFAIFIEILDHV